MRSILITGGSRGIGAATARRAAAAGWAVCLTYRGDQAAASSVVAAIERDGGRAAAVRADVAVEADVVAAVEAATTLAPLGAVVAKAGMVGGKTRGGALTRCGWWR